MKRLLAVAALLTLSAVPSAGAASHTLDFVTQCDNPTVETPYTGAFYPGGPTFTVLAETPGVYTVRCDGELVIRRVVR